MEIFPVITDEKQKIYEKVFLESEELQNDVPCICGYYGRACRNMNGQANSMLCTHCSLQIFASTVETIIEQCNAKEQLGIEYLYDSDILDIQENLKNKTISVEYSYIENVLERLVEAR